MRSGIFSLLAVLTLAACAGTGTRVVDARLTGQPVALKVGQVLEVQLDDKPATGLTWEPVQHAGKVLAALGGPRFELSEDPFRLQGSGITTQRYRAVAAGSDTLEYAYHRPTALLTADTPRLVFPIVVQ